MAANQQIDMLKNGVNRIVSFSRVFLVGIRFILLHAAFMRTAGGLTCPLGCGRKAEPQTKKKHKK